ncbi:MAG: ATP-binding cassette domain-containing protein [Gammaproteobacteria bacterium]|nr:ATP-binding cassette domain-containing protein [Gammaproteobacteria bacterium]
MIKLSHLAKTFNGKDYIVEDLSLEVAKGELLVLLGSSGSGKTTTLKMINRLVEPSSGQIMIDNEDISLLDPVALRRSIGYVFQGVGLFPHLTVEENITIILKLNGMEEGERKKLSDYFLDCVNLEPSVYASRYPDELSGGQQQRVGVARALVTNPHLLLMDEPFGAVDAINRNTLQTELLKLKGKLNKTIVFVTHDIFEAVRLGDRIAIMNQGRLEQIGTKQEIIHSPSTSFVNQLFDKTSRQLKAYMELLDE